MIQDLEQIEYPRGMLDKGTKTEDLPGDKGRERCSKPSNIMLKSSFTHDGKAEGVFMVSGLTY